MISTLLADDNPIVCESLSKTIRWGQLGCNPPRCVYDGSAARIEIEYSKPDIVVSDIRMPGMNGIDLLRWTKAEYPDVLFIMLTAFDEFQYARAALREGAFDLILKPVMNSEIEKTLKRAIRERQEKQKTISRRIILERRVEAFLSDARIKYFRDIILTDDQFMPSPDIQGIQMERSPIFRLLAYDGDLSILGQRNIINRTTERMRSLYSLSVDVFILDYRCYAVIYSGKSDSVNKDALINFVPHDECIALSGTYEDWFNLKTAFREIQRNLSEWKEEHSDAGMHSFSPQVECIIDTLRRNMSDKITLGDLASRLNMSGAHISRMLKKETGITFVDVLARIRVARAIELLGSGRYRINEAGREVGFDNYAYFYQIFKKHTGFSPREYPYSGKPFEVFTGLR